MLKTTRWLLDGGWEVKSVIVHKRSKAGAKSKFNQWNNANWKLQGEREWGIDDSGRDLTALAVALAGSVPGETKASLFSRVKRKYRQIQKQLKAEITELEQSQEDSILDSLDSREEIGRALDEETEEENND